MRALPPSEHRRIVVRPSGARGRRARIAAPALRIGASALLGSPGVAVVVVCSRSAGRPRAPRRRPRARRHRPARRRPRTAATPPPRPRVAAQPGTPGRPAAAAGGPGPGGPRPRRPRRHRRTRSGARTGAPRARRRSAARRRQPAPAGAPEAAAARSPAVGDVRRRAGPAARPRLQQQHDHRASPPARPATSAPTAGRSARSPTTRREHPDQHRLLPARHRRAAGGRRRSPRVRPARRSRASPASTTPRPGLIVIVTNDYQKRRDQALLAVAAAA